MAQSTPADHAGIPWQLDHAIAIIPGEDENTASSRLRAYALHRALSRRGIAAGIGYSADASIILVQKRITPEIIESVREIKGRSGMVLYDVDDSGEALEYWAPGHLLKDMFALADLVLTSTPEQRACLLSDHGAARVEVLPCPVDYDPLGPIRTQAPPGEVLRVLWFGNNSNYELWRKYADCLISIPKVQLVVVTDQGAIEMLAQDRPHIEFHPWARSSFVRVLHSCHMACLMHDGTQDDRAKSNNRMTTSIVWGVPAIVSRTPDYQRTAIEAGIAGALFDGLDDLPQVLERLRAPQPRRCYLDRAQMEIWRRYSPDAIAQRFMLLLQSQLLPSAVPHSMPSGSR